MGTRYERSRRAQGALECIAATCERRTALGQNALGLDGVRRPFAHLVLQGGGTLGIAHLGFVRGLEHAGIHFAGLAGTSAGAIVALLIAAARGPTVATQVSDTLLPILESMPAAAFMDGPYWGRRLVKYALGTKRSGFHEFVLPAVGSLNRVLSTYGLHRGHHFEEWLSQVLARRFQVDSITSLQSILESVRSTVTEGGHWTDLLCIVATALPIGIKATFPRDLRLFANRYQRRSPALMARASMSVPLFFEPYELDLDVATWKSHVATSIRWRLPPEAVRQALSLRTLQFIDGGLLSNFPIDAFASFGVPGEPTIPTIGVALFSSDLDQRPPRRGSVRGLARHIGATVNAMRHLRDREALEFAQRPGQARDLHVCFVDTGPHHWLNFALGPEATEDLFLRGLESCATYLDQLL